MSNLSWLPEMSIQFIKCMFSSHFYMISGYPRTLHSFPPKQNHPFNIYPYLVIIQFSLDLLFQITYFPHSSFLGSVSFIFFFSWMLISLWIRRTMAWFFFFPSNSVTIQNWTALVTGEILYRAWITARWL